MISRSHRPDPGDPATAFAAGDYHAAALGGPEHWQTYAGLGMLGMAEPALAGLSRFAGDEARFYRAATQFIAGRDREALATLEGLGDAPARALHSLIARPRIPVLAQLPYRRGAPHVLAEGLAGDARFRVANHSVDPRDLPSPPDASVFDWYRPDDPPAFYVCTMLEWHHPPTDIHRAPFPVFAQTADTDIHIQLIRRWLPSFDALLVTDTTEHAMVSRLVPDRMVAATPAPFGWSDAEASPDPARRDRPVDVFMSGIMLRSYFPDKARFLAELLREEGLNVLIIDGAVDRRRYLEIMARSKTTLCYTRNQQALVTRGLDALGVGCVPVVPRNNVLALTLPDDCACSFSPDFADIVPAVRAAVGAFGDEPPEDRAGRARSAFAAAPVASRYLRALTVRAALTAADPASRGHDPLRDTRRNAQHLNWPIPDGPALERAHRHAVDTFRARLKAAWSAEAANNLAREYLIPCMEAVRRGSPARTEPRLRLALRLLDRAIARDPDRLVLWLNYIRAAWFLGDRALREKARSRLADLLGRDESSWRVSVHDDILPPDYSDHLVDQFSYFAVLAEVPVGADARETGRERDLVRLLLASLNWLAGWALGDDSRFEAAYRLDPDHGTIAFDHALAALSRDAPLPDDIGAAIGTALRASHLQANMAAIVVAHDDRLRGHLEDEEIETCRRLAETVAAKVLPIEPTNFSRGVGRTLVFGGAPPRPTALLPRIGEITVGLVACEIEGTRPFRDGDMAALADGPYAGTTRVAGFLHPGIRRAQHWRCVAGNTLAADAAELVRTGISETRGSAVALVFDAAAFRREFEPRLLALDRLRRPVVMVRNDPDAAGPAVVGILCERSALARLKPRPRPSGREGWFDPNDLVRSVFAEGTAPDVWVPDGEPVPPAPVPVAGDTLPPNRRLVMGLLARPNRPGGPRGAFFPSRSVWLETLRGVRLALSRTLARRRVALRRWRRRPSPETLFDSDWYAARYPDAPRDPAGAYRHYRRTGAREGRDPHPLFDVAYYRELCADRGIACPDPLAHFIRIGADLGLNPNPFFDVAWYRRANPHLATEGLNPLAHYILSGEARGRDPGPRFDTRWYTGQHPEAAGGNGKALAHYLMQGAAAGLAARPDDAVADDSPL